MGTCRCSHQGSDRSHQSDHSDCLSDDSGEAILTEARSGMTRQTLGSSVRRPSQHGETAQFGQFWPNTPRREDNATQDLSLHASGFSLYVRGVAFGRRLRRFGGRACPLIDGSLERTGSVDWPGKVASLRRPLACSPSSGSTICHLTRIRTIPGGNSRD